MIIIDVTAAVDRGLLLVQSMPCGEFHYNKIRVWLVSL